MGLEPRTSGAVGQHLGQRYIPRPQESFAEPDLELIQC
ncbi:hypothetical protein LEMLEM_LOCUS3726 [Lemmus lemmus]